MEQSIIEEEMNTMKIVPSGNLKKKTILISTILISLLILSANTAVPQAQGKVVTDKLDEYETYRSLTSIIESMTTVDEEAASTTVCRLLLSITNYLNDALINPELLNDFSLEELESNIKESETVTPETLLKETETTLYAIDATIQELQETDDITGEQKLTLSFWQNIINWLLQLLKNKLTSGDGSGLPDGGGNLNLLELLKSILSAAMIIPVMILKALVSGIVGIINGVLKILGSILVIFLLLLAGLQTSLTLGAFFFIFLGLMSKVGIKAFSIIGAPIFALIAAQISVSSGSLLGGISMALFSILGIIILLALPLSIAALLYFTRGSNDGDGSDFDFNFDFEGTGIIYMILSLLANILNGSSE
jgi:hypothetical protein